MKKVNITSLKELKEFAKSHSEHLMKEQHLAALSGDDLSERCYHGMNCAYINMLNAIESLELNSVEIMDWDEGL